MVLAIKINDNIKANRDVSDITFGYAYFEAINSINSIFNIFDDTTFTTFATTIFNNFNPPEAYNLYYLADSKIVAQTLNTQFTQNYNELSINPSITPESLPVLENILNFFGFVISKYPSEKQFNVLNELKNSGIINYYWIEDHVSQPFISKFFMPSTIIGDTNNPINSQKPMNVAQISNHNNAELDLNLGEFENRGLGATIICFEESATDNIDTIQKSSTLLTNFSSQSAFLPSVGLVSREGNLEHQTNTLVTIFAKNIEPLNVNEFRYDGIAPESNVVIISVKPINNNDYMGTVRQKLIDLKKLNLKNAILLFEFEADIYKGKHKIAIGRYPVAIFKDISRMLSYVVSQNNIIVVMGSGNMGIDFDKLKSPPWSFPTNTYHDLSKKNDSLIMVGAAQIDNNGSFMANVGSLDNENTNNISTNLDVYMFTDFAIRGFNNELLRYGGTSASVAIIAGIIAFLQGKALTSFQDNGLPVPSPQFKMPLTTKIIKQVFKNTFLKDAQYPQNVLTPTTLAQLWEECQKVMQNAIQQA